MTSKTVERLVEEALDAFDDPQTSVASLVRRAVRIATKRQDFPALIRLLPETFDLSVTQRLDSPAMIDARYNLSALLGQVEAERIALRLIGRHMRDRATADAGTINGLSIAQIESQLREVAELIDFYSRAPVGMTEIDTYFVVKDYEGAAAKLIPIRRGLVLIVERVRQSVHDVLLDIEHQIESGQRRPSVFERGQEYVQRALTARAPDALEKFEAAETALADGSPESMAHALTSCRRMIKALADALYPATDLTIVGEDGKPRLMSDDAYRNRLLQFVIERLGTSTHGDLARETLRSLGSRLTRLNELSSKGVHDEVDRAEAETCIMWTYLTAADFLRIADGTASAASASLESASDA